jgi:hypothetical protein
MFERVDISVKRIEEGSDISARLMNADHTKVLCDITGQPV